MMIPFLLAAAALSPDAPPTCTMRQIRVPAGKINHGAQAMTCTDARAKAVPVRESRVVTPRKKV